ncbi:MAG: RNA polymerase sigma factor region1.1 domain-containing protein, partial [Duodenibacillus sp.]
MATKKTVRTKKTAVEEKDSAKWLEEKVELADNVQVIAEEETKPAKKTTTRKRVAKKTAEAVAEVAEPAAEPAPKPKRTRKSKASTADSVAPAKKAKASSDESAAPAKKTKTGRKTKAREELEDEEAIVDIDPEDGDDTDELAAIENLEKLADQIEAIESGSGSAPAAEDEEGSTNGGAKGYSALVRLGRQRGWVTLSEINDHLPDNAVRTEEALTEITEQLQRLGIQTYEAPPSEDDIIMNNAVSDDDDISEEDAAAMLTPEESAGLSKDPLRAYLRGVGSHKLLTRAGEIEVAKSIELFTARLLSAIIRHPMAVEELIKMAEVLRSDDAAIDQVIDGFTDSQALAEIDENDEGASDGVTTDIGAAAMTTEQLQEMKQRAIQLFDDCEIYLGQIRECFRDPKRQDVYKASREAITRELAPARFAVKAVMQLTEHINAHMDGVNDIIRRLRALMVDRCRVPQDRFLA